MGHRQWVVMEGVRWRPAENRVAAVRGRGNGRTCISLQFYLILTLHSGKIEVCMIESCKAFGSSVLEFSKT